MRLNRIRKTGSVVASILLLGAVSVMSVNAIDDVQSEQDDLDSVEQDGWFPNRRDVLSAIPDTFCAAWVTGISRDNGARGQSIQLGDHPNSRGGYFSASYSFQNWWHQKLTDVKRIRASFLTPIGTVNGASSPSFHLEVANADGTPLMDNGKAVVIYLDPALFSGADVGIWRDCDFTGDKTDCSIVDSRGVQFSSDGGQSAWSKLVSDPYYAGKRVGLLSLKQLASIGPNFVDRIKLDNACFTKQP